MPELCRFYGIIVRMFSERGNRHNKPHIHAIYGDCEIVISLDGLILEGGFPNKQLKILEGWMAIHEDELIKNWELLKAGKRYFKIKPIR